MPHLADGFQEAEGRELDERKAALHDATRKLLGRARLERLLEEGGQALKNVAAQHDGAAQDVDLPQNLVHLIQRLQQPVWPSSAFPLSKNAAQVTRNATR